MTHVQGALFRVLLVVLLTLVALMVTAPTRREVVELQPSLVTTPTTTTPVIYEEGEMP